MATRRPWELKGWFYHHFHKGETHARECLQCWQDRDVFDLAFKWYKEGNHDFVPTKLSGPRFSNEICKAYRQRLLPDAAKKKRAKTKSAKELREEVARWRNRFDRLADEHTKWAVQGHRVPVVLNAITQEIATEEEPTVYPLHAAAEDDDGEGADDQGAGDHSTEAETESDDADEVVEDTSAQVDAEDGTVEGTEQYPGVVESDGHDDGNGSVAEQERHLGVEPTNGVGNDNSTALLVASAPIVPPPTEDQIVPPTEDETQQPKLDDVAAAMSDEEYQVINNRFCLKPWAGVAGKADLGLQRKRAAIFKLKPDFGFDDQTTIRKCDKGFIRTVLTVQHVVEGLRDERRRQADAYARRKNRKGAAEKGAE